MAVGRGAHVRGPFTRVRFDGTGEDGRVVSGRGARPRGVDQPAMRAARSLPTSAVDRTRSAPLRSAMSSATAFSTRAASARQAQVLEQQGDRQHRGGGVGLALARDVRRGAVHRLEHAGRRAVRVDVGRRRQPDAAGDRRGEVREDVAEQVVGDDHVEPRRVGDQEDGRRVHVQVVDRHVGELGVHGLDRAAPQVAGVHEHVVLVHERELLARAGRGTREGVADHALDAERGVHADLVGHLVRGADADGAAVADVRALGALADHHEVDLARVAPAGDATPGYRRLGRRLT